MVPSPIPKGLKTGVAFENANHKIRARGYASARGDLRTPQQLKHVNLAENYTLFNKATIVIPIKKRSKAPPTGQQA